MKRLTALIVFLLALCLCTTFAACALADGEATGGTCQHPNITYTVTKEATCTENGAQEGTCPDCNVTSTESIKAGHDACGDTCTRCQTFVAHSPSEDGSVCVNCGDAIQTEEEGDTCTEHDWDFENRQYDETHHWFNCKNCTATYEYNPHSVNCTTGACYDCGLVNSTTEATHLVSATPEYQFDGTQHWEVCLNCHEAVNHSAHTPSETDSSVCSVCNNPISSGNTGSEGGDDETIVDCEAIGNAHDWDETEIVTAPTCTTDGVSVTPCKNCTAKRVVNLPAAHTPSETDSTVCSVCNESISSGDTGTEDEGGAYCTDNSYDWKWVADGTEHYAICNVCGKEAPDTRTLHTITCMNPNSCRNCGSTELGDTFFDHEGYTTVYNDTQHYMHCTACNVDDYFMAHVISCKNEGVCVECGATGVSGAAGHNWKFGEYESDDTYHWYTCADCGTVSQKDTHVRVCTSASGACDVCKRSNATCEVNHEIDWKTYGYDADSHWYVCPYHSDVKIEENAHLVSCAAPTTCSICGNTNATGNSKHSIGNNTWQSTDTECWYICSVCGEEADRWSHWRNCENTGCGRCGRTDVTCEISHSTNITSIWYYDEATHWKNCIFCGQPINPEAHNYTSACISKTDDTKHWKYCSECEGGEVADDHYAFCGEDPNTCWFCGETGVTCVFNHNLDRSKMEYDDNQHWYACGVCGEPGNKFDHNFVDGVCACGKEESVGCSHNYVTTTTNATCTANGLTKTACSKCGDVQSSTTIPALGHNSTTTTTAATCTADGSKVSTCTRCGKVTSSSSTPALGHDYATVETKPATCTEAGLTEVICSRCGDVESSTTVKKTGHDRWFMVPQVATCTEEGIREWYCKTCRKDLGTEAIPAKGHDLSTTETDEATVESCSRCSYQVVTPKATATPAPTSTPAPTAEPTVEPATEPTAEPAVLPEEVVVTPVEEAVVEAEDAPETVRIAVDEVALEEAPVLPLPEDVEPAKVLTVKVVAEDEAASYVPEKVTVSLPVTAEDEAALAGTKLVLILSDGTMIEVPYEIVDGKLVFTTSQLGVFAFVPAE